ncbi:MULTISPECIES: hypothetical protein [Streptomycetaceae]|uniref:hypothetical protein n=1 Tax=Streptomycetaceae TaxID=2062 RepID=UPI003009D5E4
MGHKFSLILSREITDEESVTFKQAGGGSAVFLADTLPTNSAVSVTRIDFDDAVTETLAESIQSALDVAGEIPDLTVPGLSVPAVPKEEPPAGEAAEGELAESAQAVAASV